MKTELPYGKLPFSARKKLFFACDITRENQYASWNALANYLQGLRGYSCFGSGLARFIFVTDPSHDIDYVLCYIPRFTSRREIIRILKSIDEWDQYKYFNHQKIKYVLDVLTKKK